MNYQVFRCLLCFLSYQVNQVDNNHNHHLYYLVDLEDQDFQVFLVFLYKYIKFNSKYQVLNSKTYRIPLGLQAIQVHLLDQLLAVQHQQCPYHLKMKNLGEKIIFHNINLLTWKSWISSRPWKTWNTI